MNLNKTVRSYEDLYSSEFQEKLNNNPNAIVLDVRTPDEFQSGKLPEAVNINIMDHNFLNNISGLDRSKTYFVYCRSGARSGQACAVMASQGYEVINLAGGIINWNGEVC